MGLGCLPRPPRVSRGQGVQDVLFDGERAGTIEESERGMLFRYDAAWLEREDAQPVSLTLPLSDQPYETPSGPHPFFSGLLPEGWLFNLALGKLKVARDDWFGQLLTLCRDCVGAVSIEPEVHEA